jgi:membrane protein
VTVQSGRSSPAKLRSLPWRRIARRVVSEAWDDDVLGRAAQLAYFWLFSLFPVLLIIVVILGL